MNLVMGKENREGGRVGIRGREKKQGGEEGRAGGKR